MNKPQNGIETKWLPEPNNHTEEDIDIMDIIEDETFRLAELFDPLWEDFLSSGMDWEDALATGYMTY